MEVHKMRESKYNRPLTIAFTQEIFEKIKRLTDQQKISMAQWIRAAAEQVLKLEVKND
jgi:hypothetical protein